MTCDNCIRLTRELREAREEIREWARRRERETPINRDARGTFASRAESPCFATDRAKDIAKAFNMTPIEARATDALFENGALSKTELMNAMECAETVSTQIVKSVICNARRKIGYGSIEAVKYYGYQMTEYGRSQIRTAINGS